VPVPWFSGPRRPSGVAPPPGHRSPALTAILDDLPPGSRHAVLDLGPPVASNIKMLSALECRVRVADILRSLSAEPVESRRPEAMGALYERLLPLEPDERFDALLAWDVFDYMRPDQVSSLMAWLTPACRPGALALVLVSTRAQIPARPRRYRIVDRDSLAYDGPSHPAFPCPRYGQNDLARMMPGFSVRRSFLLRSGIQEYLLARGAGEGAAEGRDTGVAARAPAGRSWYRRSRL
jgi:hypothetical protein